MNRRNVIENLCRIYISRQNSTIEEARKLYKDFVRPLVSDTLPYTDIGTFIENVGDELFKSRPASTTYIMVFLEFVSEIYVKMDNCEDIIIMSAANVIEKTEFEIKTPTLFTVIMSSLFKILNVFIMTTSYSH